MFTGIVTQRGVVAAVSPAPAGAGALRMALAWARPTTGTAVGDSVALDGVCLTAVVATDRGAEFDVVPETLRRTTLGSRRPGDRVNVEPALRVGDPLGGHWVAGHVDGVGAVEAVERRGDDVRLVVALPDGLHGCAIEKGSIAFDGVSLTVGECNDERVAVYLIPHTLAATGLGEKRAGDRVNVEADVLGRYIEHHVRRCLAGASPSRVLEPAVAFRALTAPALRIGAGDPGRVALSEVSA